MASIVRGQTSDCTHVVLDLFTRMGSVLTDVAELSFQIFDKVSGPSPVQLYPTSGRQTVDVDVACPTGDKLGTGHYIARWTAPDAAAIGTHEIRWFFKKTPSSSEQTFAEEFEVTAATAAAPHEYATVQQLRDEGVTTAQSTDAQLLTKIRRMSALIDRWTGRWFYPKSTVLTLDGTGKNMLLIGPPIISISQVKLLGQGAVLITASDDIVDLPEIRVFNRHLTQGLLDPDDRNSPKIQWLTFESYGERAIEIVNRGLFPRGVQNIEVTGVFGYTDPDGTPAGKTPDLINWACMQMVVRDLAPLGDTDARDEQAMRGRMTSLRTRDQSITWSAQTVKNSGTWTGDPQIDGIIASYRRPPTLGAA
jgi:hypothetical protein